MDRQWPIRYTFWGQIRTEFCTALASVCAGAVLAQKFWGRGDIAPISPFITEFIIFVLRNIKIRTSYRPTFEIYH